MPVNTTVEQYISYFRNLAVTHHLLLHNEATENGDGDIGTKAFTRWNAEEAITGLRTQIGNRALLLEMYDWETKSTNVHDIKVLHTAAFTVVQKAEIGNTASEVEAFETTEQIVNDILKRLWVDHYGKNKNRCITPFTDVVFNGITCVPVGPLFTGAYYGYRVEFEFKPKNLFDVTTPIAEDVFIDPSIS